MKRLLVCLLLSLALHAGVFVVPWQSLKLKTMTAALNPAAADQAVTVGLTDLPPVAADAALPSPPAGHEAGLALEVGAGQKPSAAYLERLSRQIFKAWDYPLSARQAGHAGVVKVFFVLDRAGRLVECRVKTSAGFAELDAAAVSAVIQGGPYGAFGPEIAADTLSITARLCYVLD